MNPSGQSNTEAWLEAAGPKREAQEADRFGPWEGRDLIWLTGITLLAGLLRLFWLGEWSFWIDEIHSIRDAVLLTTSEFFKTPTSRYPLSFLLLRWVHPFLPGSGEGSYRLLFVFFGIASIPLTAVVLRFFLGRGPALVAAAILGLSPWHLYWSQNCRFYVLVLFLCMASLGCFRLGIERGKGSWIFGSFFFGILAFLAHPSSLLLFAAYFVFLFLIRRDFARWPDNLHRRTLYPLFIPLILLAGISQIPGIMGNLFEILETFSRAKGAGTLFHLTSTTVFFLRIPVLVTAACGAWILWKRRDRGGLLLVSFVLVPLLGVAMATIFVKATAQYIFFTLPAWVALSAFGIWEGIRGLEGTDTIRKVGRGVALVIVLCDLASQDYLYFFFRHGDRPRWRDAADYVQFHSKQSDLVASTNEPCMEWYLNPNRPLLGRMEARGEWNKKVELLAEWTLEDKKLETWMEQSLREKTKLWLVLTEPEFEEMDRLGKYGDWVRKNFHQVGRFENWNGPKDMTVLVYLFDPEAR